MLLVEGVKSLSTVYRPALLHRQHILAYAMNHFEIYSPAHISAIYQVNSMASFLYRIIFSVKYRLLLPATHESTKLKR